MKITRRFYVSLLTFIVGVFAVVGWSAYIGRKVWSPNVFGWRNPLKPQPIIEDQANCPVRLINGRFYSFMSIGSSIGSVLKIDVENVSDKPIHSFSVSFHSLEPTDTGSIGVRAEILLQPGNSETIGKSSNGNERATVSVDFVQFANGEVWYADPPRNTVKPEGVQAGARAAADYLRQVLKSDGGAAVTDVLPRINTKVEPPKPSINDLFGHFGFYSGVTNTVVRVEYAYQQNGLSGVEEFLTREYENNSGSNNLLSKL